MYNFVIKTVFQSFLIIFHSGYIVLNTEQLWEFSFISLLKAHISIFFIISILVISSIPCVHAYGFKSF